ncbi:MAG: QueT transporter family protein [Bacilli bacterium]|nr:QueT transporter family protein [Bacilli bacterium]
MTNNITKKIVENAIVAAIYFVLTIALGNFAYMDIQFRVSEVLVLLCFWRPDFIIGVTVGTFLANIPSPLGLYDMLFGTGATLLAALLCAYASPKLAVATLWPTIVNAFVVGAELYFAFGFENVTEFFVTAGYVAIGEFAVMIVGYILWILLSKNKGFMEVLAPERHLAARW